MSYRLLAVWDLVLLMLIAYQGFAPWAFGFAVEVQWVGFTMNWQGLPQENPHSNSLGQGLMNQAPMEVIAQRDVQRHTGEKKPYLYDFVTNTKGILDAQSIVDTKEEETVLIPLPKDAVADDGEPASESCESKAILDVKDGTDSQMDP